MNPIRSRIARSAALLMVLAIPTVAISAVAQSDEVPTMSVEVTGLDSGAVVTDNHIDLEVTPVGYELSAAHAGTAPVDGIGHFHLVLDGGLIDMVTTSTATLSLQNVAPGPHTVAVVPAMNNHMPVMEGAVAIEFDYQPESALPEITAVDGAGATPTITIESHTDGDTVSGVFDMTVSTTDFEFSGDLFGKPNLAGFGHWHVFLDAADGMGTMMGMAGVETFSIDTSAITPGPHTFFAVLVDNLHAPFAPPIATRLELIVEESDGATVSAASVAVSLSEFALEPNALDFGAGEVTFNAANDGSIPHALVIEGEGIRVGTPDTSYAAGETQSFTVDLAPGTYEIFCPVPGHKDAGMSGTVTVS